jgi:hypothetical protein
MLAPPRPLEPPSTEGCAAELPEAFSIPAALCAELRFSPEQFAALCLANPEAVLELASPGDEGPRGLSALRRKMAAYQRNGARLGWLLIPSERAVEIWEPHAEPPVQPRRIEAASRLEADPQFPGLVVELEPIWAA